MLILEMKLNKLEDDRANENLIIETINEQTIDNWLIKNFQNTYQEIERSRDIIDEISNIDSWNEEKMNELFKISHKKDREKRKKSRKIENKKNKTENVVQNQKIRKISSQNCNECDKQNHRFLQYFIYFQKNQHWSTRLTASISANVETQLEILMKKEKNVMKRILIFKKNFE